MDKISRDDPKTFILPKDTKNTGPSCSNPGYDSANPGLNFNPDLFFFSSIVLCGIFFHILFLQYPILKLLGKENYTEFVFKLSNLSSNFSLTAWVTLRLITHLQTTRPRFINI